MTMMMSGVGDLTWYGEDDEVERNPRIPPKDVVLVVARELGAIETRVYSDRVEFENCTSDLTFEALASASEALGTKLIDVGTEHGYYGSYHSLVTARYK